MQKYSNAASIGLSLLLTCSSHSATPARATTNQSSQEIFRLPPLGEEWSPSKSQTLCPNQKHLSIYDFDKIDQVKSKQDAMRACGFIEAMLNQTEHEEAEIRFLLVAGAATAGSLVVFSHQVIQ